MMWQHVLAQLDPSGKSPPLKYSPTVGPSFGRDAALEDTEKIIDLLEGAEVTEQPIEGEYVALASAVRRG